MLVRKGRVAEADFSLLFEKKKNKNSLLFGQHEAPEGNDGIIKLCVCSADLQGGVKVFGCAQPQGFPSRGNLQLPSEAQRAAGAPRGQLTLQNLGQAAWAGQENLPSAGMRFIGMPRRKHLMKFNN